jgi:hypothetical protein
MGGIPIPPVFSQVPFHELRCSVRDIKRPLLLPYDNLLW